jgi:hypothetical protein
MQGSREDPLATLSEALLRLRGKTDEREIVLLAGIHPVRKTVQIDAKDSGLPGRPLKIRGEGKDVLLSGYLPLPAAGWRKVTDIRDLQRINDPDVRDRLMQFRFNDADRSTLGEWDPRGFTVNGKMQRPPAMLYLGGMRMRIARWPNVGTIRSSNVMAAGVPSPGKGGDDRLDSRGGGDIFRINSHRPKRWSSPAEVWVNGRLGHARQWSFSRVEDISGDGNEIRLTHGEVLGAGADKLHPPEFFFENVFEELDEPHEYFIDTARGLLFFLPPPNFPGWASGTRLSWSKEPILQIKGGRHIELSGLRVEGTRADGIVVEDALNVVLEDLVVRECGGDGVVLNGRDIRIKGLLAEDLGGRGMLMQGGDPVNLKTSGNTVSGSQFVGTGWWTPAWHPALELVGVGHRVRDCIFSDLPHMAVQISGNDFLIERCWFHRTCRNLLEMGAIYSSLGDQPHMRGTVIRGNLFQDIGLGGDGPGGAICLDDGTMGMRIIDNVFHRVGAGNDGWAIVNRGGAHIAVENNAFIDCPVPFYLQFNKRDERGETVFLKRMASWRKLLGSESTEKHRSRYPQLSAFFDEDRKVPDTNSFSGNLLANGRRQLLAEKGYIVSGALPDKLIVSGNVLGGALKGISFDSGGRPIIPGWRPWRSMAVNHH